MKRPGRRILVRCSTAECPARFYVHVGRTRSSHGALRRKCALCAERSAKRREQARLKRLAAIAIRNAPPVRPIEEVVEDHPPLTIIERLAIIENWQRAG